jgi:hypothetical protein
MKPAPQVLLVLFLAALSSFSFSQNSETTKPEASLRQPPGKYNWLELKEGETIASVTVVLVPATTLFIVPLSEAALQRFGRRYSTQDGNKISQILEILDSAELEQDSSENEWWESRTAIYFRTTDGLEAKLVLGPGFLNEKFMEGRLEDLSRGISDIKVRPSLSLQIYNWAVSLQGPTQNDGSP